MGGRSLATYWTTEWTTISLVMMWLLYLFSIGVLMSGIFPSSDYVSFLRKGFILLSCIHIILYVLSYVKWYQRKWQKVWNGRTLHHSFESHSYYFVRVVMHKWYYRKWVCKFNPPHRQIGAYEVMAWQVRVWQVLIIIRQATLYYSSPSASQEDCSNRRHYPQEISNDCPDSVLFSSSSSSPVVWEKGMNMHYIEGNLQ